MKFYQSNQGNIFPVEVKADGSIMLYNVTTGKPLEKMTAEMVRSFIGGAEAILKKCKESPAQTMEEMQQWVAMVEEAQQQLWMDESDSLWEHLKERCAVYRREIEQLKRERRQTMSAK